jgi:hypothetical protein
MPQYVVLHHTGHGPAHYDLMLAMDDVSPLLTWRLPAWPPAPGTSATPLPAHRREYLTYEGSVSGDRGEVRRVAEGPFELVSQQVDRIQIRLGTPPFELALPQTI